MPELETIAKVLNRHVAGETISSASVRIPVVIRRPAEEEFLDVLTGNRLLETRRQGKYLLTPLESGHVLAVNRMLTGRLQLADAGAKLPRRATWILAFANGKEIRNYGERMDTRVYLVTVDDLSLIPRFDEMGPDVMDPALTFEVFKQRIKRFPGQIKRSLVNAAFVAGIGNAYADEILFEAEIYPFEPAKKLPESKLRDLCDAIPKVYGWAIPTVEERMGERVDIKIRDHLKVHNKGGEPCPVCGARIAEVSPNQRVTSYCRSCQGWGRRSFAAQA